MKKADIVVIGGSAAGVTVGITARRHYSEKTIILIRQEKQALIPCGIPYVFGTLGSPEKDLLSDAALDKNKIELIVAKAMEIDRENKIVKTNDGDVEYDRLIVATGSNPVVPPIPGVNMSGVFPVLKEVDSLQNLQHRLKEAKDVVVIGGGFIGVEFADEIKKSGVDNVTIVEMMPCCLSLAYDNEFCIEMEKHIKSRGIKILTGIKVEQIKGSGRVETVALSNGAEVRADVVILGIGAVADVDLAKQAQLKITENGSIAVDRTMQTSDDNIFACGDCAEKISFFGGKPSPLKLASIATSEARIAGANLFGLNRENVGTVGVWSTSVGDLAIGTAGLTEVMAKKIGYNTVCATVDGPNRHPGGMPGAVNAKMKLLFERSSGIILGGQVMGDAAVGEVVNGISACIQKKMTAEEIAVFQTGTHPALTASPIAYPLVNAAEIAIAEMRKQG